MLTASVRFSALLAILSLGGCAWAGVTDQRLSKVEDSVDDLRMQETRLALVEDRVHELANAVEALKEAPPGVSAPTKAAPPRRRPAQSAVPRPVQAEAQSLGQGGQEAAGQKERPAGRPRISREQQAAYDAALSTFEAGKAQAAHGLFTNFLETYPLSLLAPNAGYWLGESYYAMQQYDKAIFAFRDVISKFPKHDKAAASLLKAGFAYQKLGDKDNARFYLETLVQDFPDSAPARLARQRLGAL